MYSMGRPFNLEVLLLKLIKLDYGKPKAEIHICSMFMLPPLYIFLLDNSKPGRIYRGN